MDEFGFIANFLSGLSGPEGLSLKDDAAVWTPPKGFDAVISMDTQVEGIHFPDGKFDTETAEKLVRVNISDLIAKGADPAGYFLSLALSEDINKDALENFCQGLASAQSIYNIKLWGGDTTRTKNKNVLTITMIGTLPKGKTVQRSGAKPDDLVCVTGTIGDSYLGLKTALKQVNADTSQAKYWRHAYHIPNPPFGMRMAIRKYAAAAIDISDGLIADAGHICDVSGVGMDIFLTTVPLSSASTRWVLGEKKHLNARLQLATGGDDYQVLMCVSKRNISGLKRQANKLGIPLTVIGKVTQAQGVTCKDSQGNEIEVKEPGYTHF